MATRLRPFPSSILATLAKLLFALAVFVTAIVGYMLVEPALRLRRPLPGAASGEGPCRVWLVGSSSIYRWKDAGSAMEPWLVQNRGIGGALLDELQRRSVAEEVSAAPAALLFYAGENDIAAGASPEAAAASLINLIDGQTKRMPNTTMLAVGLKPSPARWQQRYAQLRFNKLIGDAATTRRTLVYLPAAEALIVNGRPGPFFEKDGIHLNETGYRIWGGSIRVAFEQAMPRRVVKNCVVPRTGGSRAN